MRFTLLLLLLLSGPRALAQPAPPDPLPDSVRATLAFELNEMHRTDQRVRFMYTYGLFSPCEAEALRLEMKDLPRDAYLARRSALIAEADARLTPAQRELLRRRMNDTDALLLARLREIIAEYGWPSDERTGADANPVTFLLHAPHRMDEMRDELMAEVRAGRLPGVHLAMALDKARVVRGELQLYGTGDEYDAESGTVQPPRIADLEATNAARAELGMPPIEAYRLAN